MLQSIREHTQGWIASIIISVIILSFALWGIHSYFVGGGVNHDVAEVNGVAISKNQLAVAYERLRRQVQSQYKPDHPFRRNENLLKQQALKGLIEMEVLQQGSIQQGFKISDSQVDQFLQMIPEFQVGGQFSVERFQSVLASSLLTPNEFLELIKTNLIIDQPRLGILLSSFAMPNEVNQSVSLINEVRSFDYFIVPFSYFLSKSNHISVNDIQAYYDQHPSQFMTPEQVKLNYLELSQKDVESSIHPTKSQLEAYYHENQNNFMQPDAWKLSEYMIPVAQNAVPKELEAAKIKAKQVYESLKNPKPNKQGVKFEPLGKNWVSIRDVSEEFKPSLNSLNEPGKISNPIQTKKGLVILKAEAFRKASSQSFALVKQQVETHYKKQQAQEKFAELKEQLANITYEHPDSLKEAAKTLNLPIRTTALFSQTKGEDDLSQSENVRKVAFSHDVLNLGNNSDLISLPDRFVVVRVAEHVPSKRLPLPEVFNQIQKHLNTKQAEKSRKLFVMNLENQLQQGKNPQEVLKDHPITWKTNHLAGRYQNQIDTLILNKAFALPKPSLSQKQSYGVVNLVNQDLVIIRLNEVKLGAKPNKDQYEVYQDQIRLSNGMLDYELYKNSLLSQAKIKLNNT